MVDPRERKVKSMLSYKAIDCDEYLLLLNSFLTRKNNFVSTSKWVNNYDYFYIGKFSSSKNNEFMAFINWNPAFVIKFVTNVRK